MEARGHNAIKVLAAGLFALLFALLVLPPVAVQAAFDTVNSVHITADVAQDGSAAITEVWDITVDSDITEWYLEKTNLQDQQISGLSVQENGTYFTDEGEWDVDRSRGQKAGKSGIVYRGDGYELCWGIGSNGHHIFTVQYHMTNLVKGAEEDGRNVSYLYQKFLGSVDSSVASVEIVVKADGLTLTPEDTRVWGGGTTGEVFVNDGEVEARTTDTYQADDFFALLVCFDEGMFQPALQTGLDFNEIKLEALEGTNYSPEAAEDEGGDGAAGAIYEKSNTYSDDNYYDDDNNGSGWSGGGNGFASLFGGIRSLLFAVFPVAAIAGVFALLRKSGGASTTYGGGSLGGMKKEYKDPPYNRQLPWRGSMPATYTRLKELNQLDSEGAIIGAYLLKWIHSRQVEMVKQQAGVFGNKEEDAIKLYAARLDMPAVEQRLYAMLQSAAGGDYILQNKEFEKWSRANYEKVQGWLEQYRNSGRNDMRSQGAIIEEPAKVFFGLISTTRTTLTPLGEELTLGMFGFKKYLQDFTIINERQAREVELWEEYLMFAQLFGIADTVGEQFRQLYPKYFYDMAQNMGYSRPDLFDIYLLTSLSRSYGRAMANGYRAGYNAAHSSSGDWSGGGGGFSGGGGFGGASGGGHSGGR